MMRKGYIAMMITALSCVVMANEPVHVKLGKWTFTSTFLGAPVPPMTETVCVKNYDYFKVENLMDIDSPYTVLYKEQKPDRASWKLKTKLEDGAIQIIEGKVRYEGKKMEEEIVYKARGRTEKLKIVGVYKGTCK
jgi:hypothetical protein